MTERTFDLAATLPFVAERLGGQTLPVSAVLAELGVSRPPTLEPQVRDPSSEAGARGSVGRFELLRELGRGGMGVVLEARDPELRRSVAVKLLIDPGGVDEAALRRFVAEAQLTSQLEHPNIVPVHDMGATPDGRLFFVMKKVAGRSLDDVLGALRAGEPAVAEEWTPARLLQAFVQVCHAVAYAHDRGVLHRDLKPANIMLGRFGEVLVMDWGVARLVEGEEEEVTRPRAAIDRVRVMRTLDGAAIGTPGYMAPEQARGDVGLIDTRSDVFSLGAVLYEILTLAPPFSGPDLPSVLFATISAEPPEPRGSASRPVPEEIAEVALRALRKEPGERFAGVEALRGAVQAFLDGTRRRERAGAFVAEARRADVRDRELAERRTRVLAQRDGLAERLPPWAPPDEKRDLFSATDELDRLDAERPEAFGELVRLCEQALAQDPGHEEARALLADGYRRRFEEAEAAGDAAQAAYLAGRIRAYDSGRHAAFLRGDGSLRLETDPPGAEVVCARYEKRGLVWPLRESRVLGRTPLRDLALPMGSYRLVLRMPGYRDTIYPVRIDRCGRWDSGPEPVRLMTERELGSGIVYVPGGPFRAGSAEIGSVLPLSEPVLPGFGMAVFHVTMGEYAEFLTDLHLGGRSDEAWARCPRLSADPGGAHGQYWERPLPGRPFRVPEVDRDGDRWDPRWPVNGVSFEDACAYADWLSARTGRRFRLPTELQWEKAARGVDGRLYPWGDRFDATLCKTDRSRSVRSIPEPVGAFPTDVSVYGVRDLAGSSRSWCLEADSIGDPEGRPIRGGSWATDERASRATDRASRLPWLVISGVGFRLAVEL